MRQMPRRCAGSPLGSEVLFDIENTTCAVAHAERKLACITRPSIDPSKQIDALTQKSGYWFFRPGLAVE